MRPCLRLNNEERRSCLTLLIQYELSASLSAVRIDAKKIISRLLTEFSTPSLFLVIDGLIINIWFLRRQKKVAFREGRVEGDITDKHPILTLLQSFLETIGDVVTIRCEDPFRQPFNVVFHWSNC